MTIPAYPYWPMLNGAKYLFSRSSIVGGWNPATLQIWVDSSQTFFLNGQNFEYTRNETPAGITYNEYHQNVGEETGPTFQRMAGVWDNRYFVGEGINDVGMFIYPPEPFLTQNPIAGEVMDVYSVVRKSATDPTVLNPAYRTKYRTLGHYDEWGNAHWPDCWRTALVEYTSDIPHHVYNFTFARNIGLVDILIGAIAAGNTIAGYKLYMQTYTPPPSAP